MKLKKTFLVLLFTMLSVVCLLLGQNNRVRATARHTMTIRDGGALIYARNGHVLYRRGEKAFLESERKVRYFGRPQWFKGWLFYSIGDRRYVKAYNIAALDGQGVLTLSHNSYVYDKNGHRKGKKLLRQGMPLKPVDKVKKVQTYKLKNYYLDGTVLGSTTYIPYHCLKGKDYYQIGKNKFVRCMNVGAYKGDPIGAKQTSITLKRNAYVYNLLEQKVGRVKKGKKFLVDASRIGKIYTLATTYYHIKGDQDRFISEDDIVIKPHQAKYMEKSRQILESYKGLHTSYFVGQGKPYNMKGEARKEQLGPGYPGEASELIYLWVPADKKAELFYRSSPHWWININLDQPGQEKYATDWGTEYYPAKSFKLVHGPHLQVVNTPEDAKKDTQRASDSDKQTLHSLVDHSTVVKKTRRYRLADHNQYLGCLQTARDILRNPNATLAEVWQISRDLRDVESQLHGAKAHVKNIHHLTEREALKIIDLAYNDYSDRYNPEEVDIHFNKSRTKLIMQGDEDAYDHIPRRVLRISHYATQHY